MNAMSKAMHKRCTGRTSRVAGAALRSCVALWLILQIVFTSIHLYLEPHSDRRDLARVRPRPGPHRSSAMTAMTMMGTMSAIPPRSTISRR